MGYEKGEEFFLKGIDTGKAFELIGRADYLLLYEVRKCIEEKGKEDAIYLTDLAECMHMTVVEVSRTVKVLEDKGYVVWQTDDDRKHTYIKLSQKAADRMEEQRKRMAAVYHKLKERVSEEELEQTMKTLAVIREILQET